MVVYVVWCLVLLCWRCDHALIWSICHEQRCGELQLWHSLLCVFPDIAHCYVIWQAYLYDCMTTSSERISWQVWFWRLLSFDLLFWWLQLQFIQLLSVVLYCFLRTIFAMMHESVHLHQRNHWTASCHDGSFMSINLFSLQFRSSFNKMRSYVLVWRSRWAQAGLTVTVESTTV